MSSAARWKAAGLATGCFFAFCAMDASGVSVRMPRSTLVSKPELQFALEREQRGGERIDTLLHKPGAGDPIPVAVLSVSSTRVAIQRLPLPAGGNDLEIATLEHLYVLALQEEPEARFSFLPLPRERVAERDGLSHAQLLRVLVDARQRAKPIVPWHVVSMEPPPGRRPDADYVAVRLSTAGKPLVGASVFFNRAPHSVCNAKTDRLGRAGCTLVDQHGHQEGHADEGHAAVTVTYPGDVKPDRVLVPTTFVLKRAAK